MLTLESLQSLIIVFPHYTVVLMTFNVKTKDKCSSNAVDTVLFTAFGCGKSIFCICRHAPINTEFCLIAFICFTHPYVCDINQNNEQCVSVCLEKQNCEVKYETGVRKQKAVCCPSSIRRVRPL